MNFLKRTNTFYSKFYLCWDVIFLGQRKSRSLWRWFQCRPKGWVCCEWGGGQCQGVEAFGDKSWLMTRKSSTALICTRLLAHSGKSACYTTETHNLFRDILNIPPLLWSKGRTPSDCFEMFCRPPSQFCIGF